MKFWENIKERGGSLRFAIEWIAERFNNNNDYIGFSVPMVLTVVVIFFFTAKTSITVDWEVASALYENATRDTEKANRIGFQIAIVIFLLITLCGFQDSRISLAELHKKERTDDNDKTIKNPQYKHFKRQRRICRFLCGIAFGSTLFLTWQTYQPIEGAGAKVIHEISNKKQSQDSLRREAKNTEIAKVKTDYSGQIAGIEKTYNESISAISAPYLQKKKGYLRRAKNWDKSYNPKAPAEARYLRHLANKEDVKRLKAIEPVKLEKTNAIAGLQKEQTRQLSIIRERSYVNDTLFTAGYISEKGRLVENIGIASVANIGRNVIFNILNLVLVWAFVFFLDGANDGVKPVDPPERRKQRKRRTASRRKSDNGSDEKPKAGHNSLSDSRLIGAETQTRYVDMRKPIDKYKKQFKRAIDSGNLMKAKGVEESQFTKWRQMGFTVTCDYETGKVSVTQTKA